MLVSRRVSQSDLTLLKHAYSISLPVTSELYTNPQVLVDGSIVGKGFMEEFLIDLFHLPLLLSSAFAITVCIETYTF